MSIIYMKIWLFEEDFPQRAGILFLWIKDVTALLPGASFSASPSQASLAGFPVDKGWAALGHTSLGL